MRKTRFRKLLLVGLGNLVSGIFFGAGCILVEHADNTWWHAESNKAQQEETVAEEKAVIKMPQLGWQSSSQRSPKADVLPSQVGDW